MKNLDDILNLITGNLDSKAKRDIYAEVKNDSNAKEVFKKVKIAWTLLSSSRKMSEYKLEKSYELLNERINEKKSPRLSSFLKYAAILVLMIGLSTLSYFSGKKTVVVPEQKIKYTSIVSGKGEISKIILPDSSVVWLNSETKLTYDNNFSFSNRNLKLSGQAFLQVTKNKNLPLIVSSGNLNVRVLGTHFDVNAYPDDDIIRVTLESGHVELLNSTDQSFKYQLTPGQSAEFEPQTDKIKIKAVDVKDYTNWKDGVLIFVDTPMAEVIKQLKRKFNFKVEVVNPKVYKSVFNAKFRNEGLKEILDLIQYTCPVSYYLIPGKNSSPPKVILDYKK